MHNCNQVRPAAWWLGALLVVGCGGGENGGEQPAPYPEGPYGTEVGAVMANLAFDAWRDPAADGFDPARLARFALSELYDPTGSAGSKLVVINACAVWCPLCGAAYGRESTYPDQIPVKYAQYHPRGVRLLGTLSQDANFMPIGNTALAEWASMFGVSFPFAADPGDQLGSFANIEAAPNYVVLSARDMRVLGVFEAGDPALWPFVDQKLAQVE